MSITKLNTYEGVPIGKENFEEYTTYLSSLVARSNPFIETTASDFNDITVLGSDQVLLYATDINKFTANNVGSGTNFVFRPIANGASIESTDTNINTTDTFNVTTSSSGVFFARIYVENDELVNNTVTLEITKDSVVIATDLVVLSGSGSHYFSKSFKCLDPLSDSFVVTLVPSDNVSVNYTFYKSEPWESGSSYLLNYKLQELVFSQGLVGRVDVYFGDENEPNIDNYTLIDTVKISANNETLGSIVFKPDDDYDTGCFVFVVEDDGSSSFVADVPIDINLYRFGDNNILTLSGTTNNSFAFITNSSRELYSFLTDKVSGSTSTPGITSWEIPLSSISEIQFGQNDLGYGFTKNLLPDVFSKLISTNYVASKNSKTVGVYGKGFILTSINGVPQVIDDQITSSGFYDSSVLESSDIIRLRSMRMGAEYPTPIFTQREDHQYAREVISGFSEVNASSPLFVSASDISLANEKYNNTLFFPYTDFNLNPSIILIQKTFISNEEVYYYYYVPMDNDFSGTGSVKKNHYRVDDPSSGKIRFNFDLPSLRKTGDLDRFWIVSAEQLSESTSANVTEYFGRVGSLYSPTANINLSTKILAFNPSSLVDTDFDFSLPQINEVPSTNIISSGGGPVIIDSEGEYSRFVLYALSYPASVDVDEIVRNQAARFQPDILKLYQYADTTGAYLVEDSVPYPIYVKILQNNVSWYNRGIRDLTYDPVSRAVYSELYVSAIYNERPVDSATIGELRRRSTLSTLSGTVSESNTTFMEEVSSNKFVVTNNIPKISMVTASKGSLLVGTTSEPQALPVGSFRQVLTVSTDSVVNWEFASTAGWDRLSLLGSPAVTTTDKTVLNIIYATDQVVFSAQNSTVIDEITGPSLVTGLNVALSTDVRVINLDVTGTVDLPPTGVIVNTYGSSTAIPSFVVASDGRLTAATDISIATNAWTTISDGSNSISAGILDALRISGTANQVSVSVGVVSGTDTVSISLSTDVVLQGFISSQFLRIPHLSTAPSSTNGNMWTTSTDVSIVLNSQVRKFSFNGHTHAASDIASGVLTTPVGGTGFGNVFTDGDLLIGNSSNGSLSRAKLSFQPSSGINVTNSNGGITISTNATSSNTINTIVLRDGLGNFSAGTITASLSGNSSTATSFQTARTINGVSFNGTANINVPTVNDLSFGLGLSSSGSFNGLSARSVSVNPGEVVMISGNQTILGQKTFTTIVLPVK